MAITPGNYNITVYQGARWAKSVAWEDEDGNPVNLTGWTARMQARKRVHHDGPPLVELTTENGRITLGGVAGTIDLELNTATTTELERLSKGVYDLELVDPSGEATRLLMGQWTVSGEVTR